MVIHYKRNPHCINFFYFGSRIDHIIGIPEGDILFFILEFHSFQSVDWVILENESTTALYLISGIVIINHKYIY